MTLDLITVCHPLRTERSDSHEVKFARLQGEEGPAQETYSGRSIKPVALLTPQKSITPL